MATLYKYLAGDREVMFLDENDEYKPEDVRQHWAQTFPELARASTTESKPGEGEEADKVVTFAKKVGTKGAILSLFEIDGSVLIGGALLAVSKSVRAIDEVEAFDVALAEIEIDAGNIRGVWVGSPEAALVPEDQVLQRIGAPMLPGFEALYNA